MRKFLEDSDLPPQEVFDAARKVEQWFVERNITDWKLMGLQNRVDNPAPVARLQSFISDRPYSEGQEFFDVVILDRSKCYDGMELFAEQGQEFPKIPYGYVLKTGHGSKFSETLDGVPPEVRHLWKAVFTSDK